MCIFFVSYPLGLNVIVSIFHTLLCYTIKYSHEDFIAKIPTHFWSNCWFIAPKRKNWKIYPTFVQGLLQISQFISSPYTFKVYIFMDIWSILRYVCWVHSKSKVKMSTRVLFYVYQWKQHISLMHIGAKYNKTNLSFMNRFIYLITFHFIFL